MTNQIHQTLIDPQFVRLSTFSRTALVGLTASTIDKAEELLATMVGQPTAAGVCLFLSQSRQVMGSQFLLASSTPLPFKTKAKVVFKGHPDLTDPETEISFKINSGSVRFPPTGTFRNYSSWICSSKLLDLEATGSDGVRIEMSELPFFGAFQVR